LTFDDVLETGPDPAFVLDPIEDRFVAANALGSAMLGYRPTELLEIPITRIHPAELPQLQDFVGRVLRDGNGTTITLTCRTRSGGYLPTEMALHAFEHEDRVYVLALIRDRSEHRNSERPLRSGSAESGTLGTWSPTD
jgi:PAS domain S-box-containing protein